jgi:hypothetical protein
MKQVAISVNTLKKVAEYIRQVSPIVQDHVRIKQAFKDSADDLVDLLVNQGVIESETKQAKAEQLASDPLAAIDTIKKTAESVQPVKLGSTDKQGHTAAKQTSDEVFEARLLGYTA